MSFLVVTHVCLSVCAGYNCTSLSLLSPLPLPLPPLSAGKIMPLQRMTQTHQFLLLRQSALQQQQQGGGGGGGGSAQLVTSVSNTHPRLQTSQQQIVGSQKMTVPAGIEQIRPNVSPLPLQQRFSAAVTSAANAMRNITSRSLQTEEVLALLKQQSLRMAASQSYRANQPSHLHSREVVPVSAQLQQQQQVVRSEHSKQSIVLSSEALGKYTQQQQQQQQQQGSTDANGSGQQQLPRVVQVPITTAMSIQSCSPSPVSFTQTPVVPLSQAANTTPTTSTPVPPSTTVSPSINTSTQHHTQEPRTTN